MHRPLKTSLSIMAAGAALAVSGVTAHASEVRNQNMPKLGTVAEQADDKSKAEVKAAVERARERGTLDRSGQARAPILGKARETFLVSPSPKTRAQVRAEVMAARETGTLDTSGEAAPASLQHNRRAFNQNQRAAHWAQQIEEMAASNS